MHGKREYGDYQTPLDFAEKVCRFLRENRQMKPSAIVEPTCGIGNILKSSLLLDADEYYGIEIDPEYCELCRQTIRDERVHIINSDCFDVSSKAFIRNSRQILIIGNPPWVTNSSLSSLGSDNLPEKRNYKQLKGLDAITGASNFDICEYILLKLIHEYRNTNTVIAMLCKTSVARNIFQEIKRCDIPFRSCEVFEFDAAKVFGIRASACLLFLQLSKQFVTSDVCKVYDFEAPNKVKSQFGFSDGHFYSNLFSAVESFDGRCCFEWRQGVKHDCAKVMELTAQDGILKNGQNKPVLIEDSLVFPLIKSSMFKAPIIHSFTKYVIITQKTIREETAYLEFKTPKTWKYLHDNIALFEGRKSSIYRNAPLFSMFGVGDYAYKKYKVGISGFYKFPLFSLLYSDDGKPVMTDDTSYFICFDSYEPAYVAMLLLNSEKVRRFLTSIVFSDAKRPYTKRVLSRIDFQKITDSLTLEDLTETEQALRLDPYVTQPMYEAFQTSINHGQLRLA